MLWSKANEVVERLRNDTRLYLPGLSERRGFSSCRVEHLLNGLVREMPVGEAYLEVGTLEGRTLEAASIGNEDKVLVGADPCGKYGLAPEPFAPHVTFHRVEWQALPALPLPVGVTFYDGDHSALATCEYMLHVVGRLATEAVLVLDDWDRAPVRTGAFTAAEMDPRWRLLREMPEYTDGLTTVPHHFGYQFGVSVWGFRK